MRTARSRAIRSTSCSARETSIGSTWSSSRVVRSRGLGIRETRAARRPARRGRPRRSGRRRARRGPVPRYRATPEQQVESHPQRRDGRPEVVGRAIDEGTLAGDAVLDPGQQAIEGPGKVADLVASCATGSRRPSSPASMESASRVRSRIGASARPASHQPPISDPAAHATPMRMSSSARRPALRSTSTSELPVTSIRSPARRDRVEQRTSARPATSCRTEAPSGRRAAGLAGVPGPGVDRPCVPAAPSHRREDTRAGRLQGVERVAALLQASSRHPRRGCAAPPASDRRRLVSNCHHTPRPASADEERERQPVPQGQAQPDAHAVVARVRDSVPVGGPQDEAGAADRLDHRGTVRSRAASRAPPTHARR